MGNKVKYRLKKRAKVGLISISMIGVLCMAYLLLCIFAGGNDFLSHTTINGINVGEMTKEEAIEAINQKYQEDSKNLSLTLLADQQTYQVDLHDNVSFDATVEVNDIYEQLNQSFIKKGYITS